MLLLPNEIINLQINFTVRLLENFQKKFYSSFRNNIWGIDFTDIQPLGKYNKGITYLLCAIDLFSKYAWFILLKDKTGISIVNAFQNIVSKRKKNK